MSKLLFFLLLTATAMSQTAPIRLVADTLGSRTTSVDSIVCIDPIYILQSVAPAADTFKLQMRWYSSYTDRMYGGWVTCPYYNMKTGEYDTSGIVIINPPEVKYIKVALGFRQMYRLTRPNTAWANLVNRRLLYNIYGIY